MINMPTSKYWRMNSKIPPRVRKFMQRHIRHHIRDYGMTQKQAVAVAYSEARAKYGLKLRR
jgi:hypothetical protein